jgi:D-alanyl-D-alanine carboxypeptidase (penicillin-binding protein 5/6)
VLAKSEILASVKVRLSWNTDRVNLVPAREFSTVVESTLDPDQVIKKVTVYENEIDAPVTKGTVLGKVELIVNVDQKIGEVDLVAADDLNRSWLLFAFDGLGGFFTSPWFWLGLGLLILIIVGYIILNIAYNRRRRRERLQRVKRY